MNKRFLNLHSGSPLLPMSEYWTEERIQRSIEERSFPLKKYYRLDGIFIRCQIFPQKELN